MNDFFDEFSVMCLSLISTCLCFPLVIALCLGKNSFLAIVINSFLEGVM